MVRPRNLGQLEAFLAHADEFGPEWSAAAVQSDSLAWLTPAELAALGEDIDALWPRYADRLADPQRRPAGARRSSCWRSATRAARPAGWPGGPRG